MKPYHKEPVSRETQARTRLGLLSLLWMFVGAIIAVMIGVFLYLSPLFDGFRKDVDVNPEVTITPLPQAPNKPSEYEFYEILPERDFKTSQSGLGEAPSVSNDEATQDDTPTTQTKAQTRAVDVVVSAKADDAQITVVEEDDTYDEPTANTTAQKIDEIQISSAQNATTYILQVRSYDNAEEADKKRSEVIMAGVDAKVVHRIDPSGVSLYQVVSMPFHSRVSAIEAEQKLSNNGIDSLLIEQRH
ncbi:MAG: SPOR domain-containing protein [Moraxella sp.]|nr:SPOR domain-containing protein [Moraxella sp.]